MIGVYKLYWPDNNYYYIGQSLHVRHRYKSHLAQLKAGKHNCQKLYNLYLAYGSPKYEVLKACLPSDLDHYEREYIMLNYDEEFCCNHHSTVPVRTIVLKVTKEDYQALSKLANLTLNKSVPKFISNLIEQTLQTCEAQNN